MTLVFLGNEEIHDFIEPDWTLPPLGILERWIFLPEETPRVVAGVPIFLEGEDELLAYQKKLAGHLKEPFTPHVSVSRGPFDRQAWEKFPCQIPFFVSGVALYKSLGYSKYEILFEKKSLAPFEEIEHTADIAYKIRGENFTQLALHATLALACKYPAFTKYLKKVPQMHSVSEIVKLLNQWIAEIDISEGINLKAVSYHAAMSDNKILEWTMVVDV